MKQATKPGFVVLTPRLEPAGPFRAHRLPRKRGGQRQPEPRSRTEYHGDGTAYTVTHYSNEERSPQENLAIMDALDRLAFDKGSEPHWIKVSVDSQPTGRLLWHGKAPDAPYASDEFRANERRLRWFRWRGWSLNWIRADFRNHPGPKQ